MSFVTEINVEDLSGQALHDEFMTLINYYEIHFANRPRLSRDLKLLEVLCQNIEKIMTACLVQDTFFEDVKAVLAGYRQEYKAIEAEQKAASVEEQRLAEDKDDFDRLFMQCLFQAVLYPVSHEDIVTSWRLLQLKNRLCKRWQDDPLAKWCLLDWQIRSSHMTQHSEYYRSFLDGVDAEKRYIVMSHQLNRAAAYFRDHVNNRPIPYCSLIYIRRWYFEIENIFQKMQDLYKKLPSDVDKALSKDIKRALTTIQMDIHNIKEILELVESYFNEEDQSFREDQLEHCHGLLEKNLNAYAEYMEEFGIECTLAHADKSMPEPWHFLYLLRDAPQLQHPDEKPVSDPIRLQHEKLFHLYCQAQHSVCAVEEIQERYPNDKSWQTMLGLYRDVAGFLMNQLKATRSSQIVMLRQDLIKQFQEDSATLS